LNSSAESANGKGDRFFQGSPNKKDQYIPCQAAGFQKWRVVVPPSYEVGNRLLSLELSMGSAPNCRRKKKKNGFRRRSMSRIRRRRRKGTENHSQRE